MTLTTEPSSAPPSSWTAPCSGHCCATRPAPSPSSPCPARHRSASPPPRSPRCRCGHRWCLSASTATRRAGDSGPRRPRGRAPARPAAAGPRPDVRDQWHRSFRQPYGMATRPTRHPDPRRHARLAGMPGRRPVIAGDHAVVLAEPRIGQHLDEGSPLLYHMGRYAPPAATTARRRPQTR